MIASNPLILPLKASLSISKSAYVPPHLRNAQRAARSTGGGLNDWAPRPASTNGISSWQPTQTQRGPDNTHPREMSGYGYWKDNRHIVGSRNFRMERELFGDAEDPSKQHTGINFEKYDDIPVEATGAGVPEPILTFTSPPLDPVLLENIGYARYSTPTPVQKYSIPIVAANRDLMACAQASDFTCQTVALHL